MKRGKIVGQIFTQGKNRYFLVDANWEITKDGFCVFNVTHAGYTRTEKVELDGLIKDVPVYAKPFRLLVNKNGLEILLDRNDEVTLDDDNPVQVD